MSTVTNPATVVPGSGARRLVRSLAALGASSEGPWEVRLVRLLEAGMEAVSAGGAVLTQANEDHHWVVAAAGASGQEIGDRLEPGATFLSAPHEEGRTLADQASGRLGTPVFRDGEPWGSLTFSAVTGPDTASTDEAGSTDEAASTDEAGSAAGESLALIAAWLSRELTVRHLEAELHRSRQHLGHLVHVDPLTELLNRRGAAETFDNFVRRSGFEGKPLSYLICGLSGMQRINGRFGRQTGDRVVRAVARTLRSSLRPGDVSARIGRYELLGILPGASLNAARSVAERVLATIEELRLATPDGDPVVPTVHIGVARVTLADDSFDDVERHVAPLLREAHRIGDIAVANGLGFDRQEAG